MRESVSGDVIKPCVLIGHPHGRKCYLTLGEWLDGEGGYSWSSVKYRIDSCKGNSGCHVLFEFGCVPLFPFAHSGEMANQSGVGTSAGFS